MALFYKPDILEQPFLSEEESRHAVKVLRLGVGDTLDIVDGKGGLFRAVIRVADARRCTIEIRESVPEPDVRRHRIHLAIAPTKDLDRIEWMLEKCVEIGVDQVTFIRTRRTDERYWKGKSIHPERLEKISVSAMKQSLKRRLPVVTDLVPWERFLAEREAGESRFVAHLEEDDRTLLQQKAIPGENYVVLIGPEGDFTPEEIAEAKENGFAPVSLGNSRLRTETAGLVAVHTLELLNQGE
jgi:16S rRNA (uracil1498-N3)-methyltransferase